MFLHFFGIENKKQQQANSSFDLSLQCRSKLKFVAVGGWARGEIECKLKAINTPSNRVSFVVPFMGLSVRLGECS